MNTALLMIDVQASFPARDYWDEALAVPWRERQHALLELARQADIPMARIFHEEPGSATPFDPANGLVRPLEGFDEPAAATFHKRAHNAFTDTELVLEGRFARIVDVAGLAKEWGMHAA
ncbi:hypothetical protein [Halomonas caseinilytica]|uniref:hypothetical protein n=1 Tax=Halomonas caseinilytica TaxID=438744 RepID=UPI0008483AC2|nr:hypothetical protein [Halomonas caseinilytica]